ncbi:hypothetical protein C4564_01515 [Candidatus Microgenomates bacterium]|nr:MAG: hypothetical protein C4564_01515 [Candidatus Microgenomates bacterium]
MSRNEQHKDGDPFDDEGMRFQERVISGYQEMAAKGWSGVPWYVVDGEKPINAVHEDVKGVLHDILGLK